MSNKQKTNVTQIQEGSYINTSEKKTKMTQRAHLGKKYLITDAINCTLKLNIKQLKSFTVSLHRFYLDLWLASHASHANLTSSVIFDFLFRVRDTSLCLTLFLFWLSMELFCGHNHGSIICLHVDHITEVTISFVSPLLPPAAPAAPSCRSSCPGFRRSWSWQGSFRCRH